MIKKILLTTAIFMMSSFTTAVADDKKPMTAVLPGKTISHSDVKKESKQEVKTPSRGVNSMDEVLFTLSFYTTLAKENGGYTVTNKGRPLKGLEDAVASNVYPTNTKIYLEKFGEVTVLDTGGKDFNRSDRLDVLIQRDKKENGQLESDYEYERRVNKMGYVKVTGWVMK